MASYQFVNNPNQVRDSFSSEVSHGRSKAQMCLQKILDFISTHASLRPPETSNESSFNPQFGRLEAEAEEKRVLLVDIDLNVKLGSPLETEAEDSGYPFGTGGGGDCEVCETEKSDSAAVSADVSMVGKSSAGECDPKEEIMNLNGCDSSENDEEESEVVVEERGRESSEVANPQVRSLVVDNNGVSEDIKIEAQEANNPLPELRRDNCLRLLIEAAKVISGEFPDDNPEPTKPSQNGHAFVGEEDHKLEESETATTMHTKRSHCWAADSYGDIDDVSPVVRSKRGRSQALPYRYRDSVLEPLSRLSRQRSTTVSTRRRSR